MGYTTEFTGSVTVTPPLNAAEVAYLTKFAETRRMNRTRGPYFVDGSGPFGQGQDTDITDYNHPDPSQPGLWCNWMPSEDGTTIGWDGSEKFYDSVEWMRYVIGHFLKPGAEASTSGDPQFAAFTFDHVCNGTIEANGEDETDLWRLIVTDNDVSRVSAEVTFHSPTISWPTD